MTTKLAPTITAVTKPIRPKPRSLPPSWPLRRPGQRSSLAKNRVRPLVAAASSNTSAVAGASSQALAVVREFGQLPHHPDDAVAIPRSAVAARHTRVHQPIGVVLQCRAAGAAEWEPGKSGNAAAEQCGARLGWIYQPSHRSERQHDATREQRCEDDLLPAEECPDGALNISDASGDVVLTRHPNRCRYSYVCLGRPEQPGRPTAR